METRVRRGVWCDVGHTSVAGDMQVSRKAHGQTREIKVAPRISDYSSLTETQRVFARGFFMEVARMKVVPSLDEAMRIAQTGEYRVLPVSCEMLSDRLTPIECLQILKQVSNHCYLLESAADNERWGRYTFLGCNPSVEVTVRDGVLKVDGETREAVDPIEAIRYE